MVGWLQLCVALAADPAPVLLTPTAVVESGHAWLERPCGRATPLTEEQKAAPPWTHQEGTIVSSRSIRVATPKAPVCFPGECGGDQVGVPVGGSDTESGALFASDAIKEAGLRSLSLLRVDGPDPYGLDVVKSERDLPPPCAPAKPVSVGPIETCHIYGELADGPLLEVRSIGAIQEDGHARYTKVEARRVTREPDAWRDGEWSVLPEGRWMGRPAPIALAATAKPQQVVWYGGGGLCCPSGGGVWMSTWANTGTWTLGSIVTGGKGQPCD